MPIILGIRNFGVQTPHQSSDPAGWPPRRVFSVPGFYPPIQSRMIDTASVAAAITTIHLRNFISFSFLTSVHREGSRQDQR